ncbi:MAG TPA: hypothetical protein VGP69_17075, partial [Gaiellaceae bacterium]|nr:hypothetical protein [Gaiellaceae bacterium]
VRSKDTGDDFLDLSGPVQGNTQRRPMVILALGAIESARMALLTPGVGSAPNGGLVGNNLMVHLRKNSTFTVAIPAGLTLNDLELTALLVRCRAKVNGAFVHYHFQISASAQPQGSGAGSSDALLFQSVPDLDNIRHFECTSSKSSGPFGLVSKAHFRRVVVVMPRIDFLVFAAPASPV